jgi:hypothetical protein
VSCVGVISHAHGGGLVGSLSSSDLAGLLPEHFVSLAGPVLQYLTARSSASWGGQQHTAAAPAGPPLSPTLQQQQQQQAQQTLGGAHAWGLKVRSAAFDTSSCLCTHIFFTLQPACWCFLAALAACLHCTAWPIALHLLTLVQRCRRACSHCLYPPLTRDKHQSANINVQGAEGHKPPPLVSISPSSTLRQVLALLASHRLHRLHVLDDRSRPVGIVTITDLLRLIVGPSELLEAYGPVRQVLLCYNIRITCHGCTGVSAGRWCVDAVSAGMHRVP